MMGPEQGIFLVLLLILAVLCASDIRTRVMKKPHIAYFYDERAKYGYIVQMVCYIGPVNTHINAVQEHIETCHRDMMPYSYEE